jgi:hypothetical protein
VRRTGAQRLRQVRVLVLIFLFVIFQEILYVIFQEILYEIFQEILYVQEILYEIFFVNF